MIPRALIKLTRIGLPMFRLIRNNDPRGYACNVSIVGPNDVEDIS